MNSSTIKLLHSRKSTSRTCTTFAIAILQHCNIAILQYCNIAIASVTAWWLLTFLANR